MKEDKLTSMQEESKKRNSHRFNEPILSVHKRNHYKKKKIKLSYDPNKIAEFIRKKMAS